MKKLTVNKDIRCMACLSCVLACSSAFYKVDDPARSCIRIIEKDGTVKSVICLQCGKCFRTCTHGAISQNAKGTYVINKKKCTGCGECAKVCPMHVIVFDGEKASKCIACGICARACPQELLEVIDR